MAIPKKLRKFLSKYYQRYKKFRFQDPFVYLVYSMGKVGSTSIYRSLKQRKPYSDVFHMHFLSENWLRNKLPKEHEIFHSNIKIGDDILKFVADNPKKRHKIITLVREPVMRSISDLFENWKHLYDNIDALEWFDTEFKEYLNIDIYELEFNKEKGYSIYNFEDFDLLCIQLEQLNDVMSEAMTAFIGEDIPLISSNTSANKNPTPSYRHTFHKIADCPWST